MLADANSSTKVDLAAVESEARQLLLGGDPEEARDVLHEARKQCQQTQDFASAGTLLRSLGDLEWSLGRFEAALRNYEQAQAQFRRGDRNEAEADVLLSIGDTRTRLGIIAGALDAFQNATTLYEALDRPLELAHCHFKLGALTRRTNPGSAEPYFVRAEELYDQVQKLDPHSMFRVENPPLPETLDDCRTIEPWIMLEVARRELAILRGQVASPRKKRKPQKAEAPVATAVPATKAVNRDLIVGGTVVLMVTALFGLLVVGAKFATPGWIPFGKIPFFIVGLIASGLSAFLVRSSEIKSKVLSGSVPVLVGVLVFFGSSMAFQKPSDAATEQLDGNTFLEADIVFEETGGESPDSKRLEMEELLARFEKAGDRRGEADTLAQLASFERSRNRSAQALDLYSRSYRLFQALGAPGSAAGVALSMGEILQSSNRLADARAQYLDGATLYEQQGDTAKRADALMRVGDVERSMGRQEAARQAYRKAYGLVASSGEFPTQVEALLRLAQIEVDSNRFAAARKVYQKAVGLAQKTEDVGLQAKAWLALGELEALAGDVEPAQAALKRSAQLAAQAGDPIREVVIWQRLGKLERATKQLPQASESFHHALQAAERSGDRDEQAATLLLLAELDSESGRLADARSRFTQAMAIYADGGKDTGRGHAAIGLGDLEVKQGRPQDARDTYLLALRFYEAGGSTNGQIETLDRLSKVVASTDPALAKSYAAKASGLRKRL